MTEQEIKLLCKLAVEKRQHQLTNLDKELLKQAIDKAKNIDELLFVALSSLNK